jgi:drug/metabolite transporter (DMT)-like permease
MEDNRNIMLGSVLIRLLFKALPERHHPVAWSLTMIFSGVCLLFLSYSLLLDALRHQSPTDVPFALMIVLVFLSAGLAICALVLGLWLLGMLRTRGKELKLRK